MFPRHYSEVTDLHDVELKQLLDDAIGIESRVLSGKRIAKRSERTRVAAAFVTTKESLRTGGSIARAAHYLGGFSETFAKNSLVDEKGQPREDLGDIARCLEGMGYDMIFARLGDHEGLQKMQEATKRIHVVNALTKASHPLQALADMAAFRKRRPGVERPNVTYYGDGNNVATSLAEATLMLRGNFTHAGPQERQIPAHRLNVLKDLANKYGSTFQWEEDPMAAATEADFVYTDVHASMGEKNDAERLKAIMAPYKVTQVILDSAKEDVVLGHCLPAEESEIDRSILWGPESIVKEIAGMRTYTTAALMRLLDRKLIA